ncbi:MAG: PEGA domain-containing protein [bacterium]
MTAISWFTNSWLTNRRRDVSGLICLLLGLVGAGLFLPAVESGAATLVLTGPAGATVSLNGDDHGRFPLAGSLTLLHGVYEVQCELPGYVPYTEIIQLDGPDAWLRLEVRLTPYSRTISVASNLLLAGLGQHYQGRTRTGYFYNAVEIGGLLAALYGEMAFLNHRDDFLLANELYESAVTETDIEYYRNETESAFDKMDSADTTRKLGLYAAAGAIVVSMLDAWLFFPSVEVGPGTTPAISGGGGATSPLLTANHRAENSASWHAGWKLSF